MSNTETRLQELLDIKDEQLSQLSEENSILRRQLDFGVDWMLHQRLSPSDDGLPVPRLEFRLVDNTDYHMESVILLVYRSSPGEVSGVPLGYSKTSGGGIRLEHFPREGKVSQALRGSLPRLAHDMYLLIDQLGLPAVVTLDEKHRYQVKQLNPVELVALPTADDAAT